MYHNHYAKILDACTQTGMPFRLTIVHIGGQPRVDVSLLDIEGRPAWSLRYEPPSPERDLFTRRDAINGVCWNIRSKGEELRGAAMVARAEALRLDP